MIEKLVFILFFIFAISNYAKAYSIINIHEHIESINESYKYLVAMDENNISMSVLLGSPNITIGLARDSEKVKFSGYDENNEELFKIKERNPDRFVIFCTIDPEDDNRLEKLKECVERGALGLKLYSGHSDFYTIPLNDSRMYPVYEYLQANKLPVMFHVNTYYYLDEFEAVLNDFPDLIVICPHFCLSTRYLTRLKRLMNEHPNLYTDISFGREPFLKAGLERISNNIEEFKEFFSNYNKRILFGTDMVVTKNPRKSKEWIGDIIQCYRGLLEKESYNCFLVDRALRGLALNDDVLKRVYEENPRSVLNLEKDEALGKESDRRFIIILLIGLIFFLIYFRKEF